MQRFGVFIATGSYVGYVPVAPGTLGSLLGLGVCFLIRLMDDIYLEMLLLSIIVGLGVWSAGVAEDYFNKEDPGVVIIDEVAGMLVTLFLIPLTFPGILLGFLVFRLFDIVKPYPARLLENLPGGWGVMMDDLVAGVYANLVVRLLVGKYPLLMMS